MTKMAEVALTLSTGALAGRAWRFLGAVVATFGLAVGVAAPAYGNLLVNGGFESGDFTGWIQLGNTGFTGVACPGPDPTVAEGDCSAFLGPVGSDGVLAQSVNLVVGQVYFLTFALQTDGGVTSDFSACFGIDTCGFGAVPLFSLADPPGGAYKTYSFAVLATAPVETVSFSFRDDPGFLYLDATAVSVPEPATVGLLGLGLGALLFARRRKALR